MRQLIPVGIRSTLLSHPLTKSFIRRRPAAVLHQTNWPPLCTVLTTSRPPRTTPNDERFQACDRAPRGQPPKGFDPDRAVPQCTSKYAVVWRTAAFITPAERRPPTGTPPEADMARLELRCLVSFYVLNDEARYLPVISWIADSYNLNTWMIVSSMVGLGLSWWQAWDLRVAWLWLRLSLHCTQCEAWGCSSYHIPRCRADILRHMGQSLVLLQQRRNGLRLVWCPGELNSDPLTLSG
jgi:hypothetical protein